MRVVVNDGTTVVGRILNQDAFSIQMLTSDERLESYARSELREHAIIQKGLMPSHEGKLGAQEIAARRYLSSGSQPTTRRPGPAKESTVERSSTPAQPHTG